MRKEGRAVRLGFKEKRVAPRLSGEKLGQSLKSKTCGSSIEILDSKRVVKGLALFGARAWFRRARA